MRSHGNSVYFVLITLIFPELRPFYLKMVFLTHESKSRIVRLRSKGKGISEIVRILAQDNVKISRWSVIRFLKRMKMPRKLAVLQKM